MTTPFDRPLSGFRFVATNRGDSLQLVAARELGDAARWVELVHLNNLVPPFITDDPTQAGAGVVLTGDQILVPAPVASSASTVDPNAIFGTDIQTGPAGALLTDGNDFVTVSGPGNLQQALKHRIETDLGDVIFWPNYGCKVRARIGVANGPTAALLAAQSVKAALRQDPRVSRVLSSVAAVDGDSVAVSSVVETAAGGPVQVNAAP